ncbi:putative metal-dependent phosphoesterase TrpH [Marmoricola sp. OAE513]|uniref:PHP domain-containing protein n=1 Tax=Marmoricola sp. OAE513 TaxID=2817894 RepID=UPI001AE8D536
MSAEPKIDLHTHSTCSDGTDTPAELVANAAIAGLTVVAVTDHDTTGGWASAMAAAEHHGIHVVRGVELSTGNLGRSQHLLGYAFDPTTPVLAELLAGGVASRARRLTAQLERLAAIGKPLSDEDLAEHLPDEGPVGKPHLATALHARGHVDSFDAGMDLLGGAAHVAREKIDIEDAIRAVSQAGGVTVVAHPWGRRARIDEARFAELREVGLTGIEAAHYEHTPKQQDALKAIAANLGLVWTGSSDYHGTRKPNRLGCHTTPVEQYERLLGQAAAH